MIQTEEWTGGGQGWSWNDHLVSCLLVLLKDGDGLNLMAAGMEKVDTLKMFLRC